MDRRILQSNRERHAGTSDHDSVLQWTSPASRQYGEKNEQRDHADEVQEPATLLGDNGLLTEADEQSTHRRPHRI